MGRRQQTDGNLALEQKKVIVIEAAQRPEAQKLRVAAYCRITGGEAQNAVFESQMTCCTKQIGANPDWIMAGVFADIGDSRSKRPEFQKMLRKCRQKKIDLVLIKSISRFARNTVDCLNYVRVLRSLGIAIIFEEQNINTLETDSEMLITMMGAFAQAESESLSGNVQWGIRQAMREDKVHIQYRWLYAYEKGGDGRPKVNPRAVGGSAADFRQLPGRSQPAHD